MSCRFVANLIAIFISLACFMNVARAALMNDPVCVTAMRANLRKGPGVQFPVSWPVGLHMPLMRTAVKGPWSEVKDLNGQKHWILSSAITTKLSCAVIKAKNAELLKGPGKKFGLADMHQADRYTAFRKVDRDGKYLLVQDEYKGEYWVDENQVWSPVTRRQVTY